MNRKISLRCLFFLWLFSSLFMILTSHRTANQISTNPVTAQSINDTQKQNNVQLTQQANPAQQTQPVFTLGLIVKNQTPFTLSGKIYRQKEIRPFGTFTISPDGGGAGILGQTLEGVIMRVQYKTRKGNRYKWFPLSAKHDGKRFDFKFKDRKLLLIPNGEQSKNRSSKALAGSLSS